MQALNSITDSSEANPYLVVIAPGVYSLSAPLVMARYISVVGSGRHATTLVAAIGATTIGLSTAVVVGSGPGRALSDLSIVNTGNGSDFSIGLLMEDDLLVERLDIVVSGSN